MSPASRLLACSLAIAALAGCSDVTGPSDADRLELLEAIAVLDAVATNLGMTFRAVDLAAGPAERQISVTMRCFLSGSIVGSGKVGGGLNAAGTRATLHMDIVHALQNCRVEHAPDRLVVTGAPYVRSTGALELSVGATGVAIEGAIGMKGAFTYDAADGRSGRCDVDIQFGYRGSTGTLKGRVCGHRIDERFPL